MKHKVGLVSHSILDLDFSKLSGLLLTDAEKVPPHIGLVHNDYYYSATANGIILDRKMSSVLDVITKKNKKVLFALFDFKFDKEVIKKTFLDYGPLINGKTCLYPAKSCIEKSTGLTFDVDFVFQLLPLMSKQNLIVNYYHFLLENHLQNGYYTLSNYGKNDIIACIDRLKR
jgi:hypothetical protein